ncbi:serine/threonine-protein kinase EDR1 isoform X2 [Gastrolobium bilobum]|uniref:serine/threonine-protein kinase EDR1 isoform X2 n=1 Tax=Gastrolobium bilobum TaxID=150636 RepID=UPI002AB06896|nr:serine/threonine-protein kinase EDR1 isoform X2 [Gastrolobium bilobum]
MPKMKHLLRKLHIGGGAATINHNHILPHADPLTHTPPSSSSSLPSPSTPTVVVSDPNPVVESENDNGSTNEGVVDFNLLQEEEFQMQLALAISASDPDLHELAESAQIDAAKQMSLGYSASLTDTKALVQFQSLRYRNYNVIAYDEKVMDGFYDVYGITSNLIERGKMPLLVDLQTTPVSGNVDCEVILVNRVVDMELNLLEKKACALFNECSVSELGLMLSGLLQKLADIVVNRMGGPVGNAEKITKRWAMRSRELRDSLRTTVLPLGCLDVGLSRHRALLFKVLADRINIPCMLVKGSYYTGTDDGAVNLIKADDGSEYIIDMMGAPGILIPAEVPSSQLQNYGFAVRGCAEIVGLPNNTHAMLDDATGVPGVLSDYGRISTMGMVQTEELLDMGSQTKPDEINYVDVNETARFKHTEAYECSSHTEPSPAEMMHVKDVSEYVLSATKHPEFAQKLHTVLVESGALPPPDLFSDMNPRDRGVDKANEIFFVDTVQADPNRLLLNYKKSLKPSQGVGSGSDTRLCQSADQLAEQRKEFHTDAISFCNSSQSDNTRNWFVTVSDRDDGLEQSNDIELEKDSAIQINETVNGDCNLFDGKSKEVNPVLGEGTEWEIQWEDLRIGERIGIGSYGEVYHADCNGTEVAVKKFLNQDFSGDALAQFKSEIEIMLRMRHPNVVLFMGAITRAPHFSILTEFLPRGSLYRLLHRPNLRLDEKRRLRMALDVVCDFGMSRMKHHTFLSSKSCAGTPEWMAPEVLRNEPANEKCDVYSFGVILWELTTIRIPWKGLNPMQVVGAVGFQNKRLEIPEDVDPVVAQIIRDCWQMEPHLRPSFSQLMSRLSRLQNLVLPKTSSTD